MENVVTNTTSTTEETGIKIKLAKPIPFDPVGTIKITTTKELCTIINEIFARAFDDYYGCTLKVQFQPDMHSYIVIPCLFFRVLKNYDPNKRYAFRTLGTASPNESMIDRIQRVSQSVVTGAQVDITSEGKYALSDFMIPSIKSSNFAWKDAFRTVTCGDETFVQVFKLDMLKFITLLYGDVSENKSKQYYQIVTLNIVGTPNQYKAPDNWSLSIMRLDYDNQAYAAELLGYNIPSQTTMPTVITERSNKF